MIKITSGKYRGRTIGTPGGTTHPMGAREKLALFNMVTEYLTGVIVLDAYAGSGALGIEALSRGAKSVVFVENSPIAIRTIKENLNKLELNDSATVVTSDIAKFHSEEKFNLILADPPYNKFNIKEVAILPKLLDKNGVMVLSHPVEIPDLPGVKLLKTHKYARARISIYKNI